MVTLLAYNVDSIFIQNCKTVSDSYYNGESDGIYLTGTTHNFIHNNCIRVPNQQPTAHVDALQGYLTNGWVITNNVFINDSVNSVEGGGIPIILGSQGTLPVIIYNNFAYMGGVWYSGGNWAGTLMTRWYDTPPMPPTWIIHNTVVSNGPRVRGMWLEFAGASTTTIINNVIAQFSTAGSGNLGTFDNSTGSTLRVDSIRNNLFYQSWGTDVGFSGNVTGNGHTGQPTGWTDWVNNYGGTGVKGDPLLVCNIGYEPNQGLLNGEIKSNSAGINQGENTESLINQLNTTYGLNGRLVWEDMNGNPRDNTPTIGAYEYTTGGSGNNPPNQPSNPNPVSGSINQPVNLTLSWACSDPDGDPLTYNVYFGTNSNPPIASTNRTSASFTPGQLNNNTTYYWKIVAKDNQGHSTSGTVWNFTTISGGGGNYIQVETGWNLISIPRLSSEMSADSLLPARISPVFWFDGYTYTEEIILQNGKGYFVNFGYPQYIYIVGESVHSSIPVFEGWNMIGVFDENVPINQITTIPSSIITSSFLGLEGSYEIEDTLKSVEDTG